MPLSYNSISGSSGPASNDFTITTGSSGYTKTLLSTDFPAGAYVITSALSDTTYDIYLISSDGSNAGSVNAAAASSTITASKSFDKVVIYGATNNDTITFQFKYVFGLSTISTTDFLGAGPYFSSSSTLNIGNIDDSVVITGNNFASDITASFYGSDSVARPAKSVTRSSSTSVTIVRPDTLPSQYAPYRIELSNPGIQNPTSTNSHKTPTTFRIKPDAPTGVTASQIDNTSMSVSWVAPTYNGGSAITSYTVTSSPGGLTATAAGTSATVSGLTANTSYTFTVTATNIAGTGVASSASSAVSTTNKPASIDYIVLAGGGSGGWFGSSTSGGGGGAGGWLTGNAYSVTAGSTYNISIGAGGASGRGYPSGNGYGNNPGSSSSFGALTATAGGGGGYGISNSSHQANGQNGGSAGGGGPSGGTGTSGQGTGGGGSNFSDRGGGGGGSQNSGNSATNTAGGSGGNGKADFLGTTRGGGGGGGGALGNTAMNTRGNGGSGGGGHGAGGSHDFGGYNAGSGSGNYGAGGGGAMQYFESYSGSGGSGMVQIRYNSNADNPTSTTGSPSVTTSGGYKVYTWNGNGSVVF